MTRIAIVGAGISGLAAAHALRHRFDLAGEPLDLVVVESSRRIGGKLHASEIGGAVVDEGAETFLARAPEATGLVEAVGLKDGLVSPATSGAAIWIGDGLVPMPQRTVLGIPSSAGLLRGVLPPTAVARAAADRWLPGKPPGDDDVAVGGWLRRRLGSAVVDRLVDPLLGGIYAGHADELSLQATMPMLRRDRRSAMAAAAASLPDPATADARPVFATLPCGLGSLASAVLAASRAELVIGRTVRAIERRPVGWRVVHGATNDAQVLDVDAVVIGIPPNPASRLLAPIAPSAAAKLESIESASLAIVTTAWRADAVSGHAPARISGYLVPAASRPRRSVKAVTFSSSKWRHLDGGNLVYVRCSIGRHREVVDLQRDDADLVALAVQELTEHAGFVGTPVASRVSRWGGALPQPAVGHRDRIAAVRADVEGRSGLAVCGATFEGVGIPACIRSGQIAAEKVCRDVVVAPGPG